ncbi:GNAT family N-acetyltransferase [Echinicola rosea]|uniref:N-acetyltransferase domain-containing protein n=1 Tax=Echinicola rosea TaxID=1807691 RepID=A0ABQ1VAV9_9BACT|nr:GNAT family N-acetyltransferase [Echinicola rosea]GGF50101.1 hypothetical protein GCM10011339_43320 [Echinicola rosea]
MQVREAQSTDHHAIVDLLKRALGESLLPKSVALWRWKHEENPFGTSPVIVAEDHGELVGVRAMMPWTFDYDGQPVKALRAVDTAVVPGYQGRGIFKRLTRELIEECSGKYQFVFNTPNPKSMSGYIKMGWQKRGRLPLKMALTRPFGLFSGSNAKEPMEVDQQDWPEDLLAEVYTGFKTTGMQTQISPEYVHWRYVENPLFRYGWFSDGHSYLCVFRIKSHKRFQEFRICELLPLGVENQVDVKDFSAQLKHQVSRYRVSIVSFSGESPVPFPSCGAYRFFPISRGPMVTLRNLGMEEQQFEELFTPNGLAFSLGDLELF